jgi:hypothetical protein
MIPVSLRNFRTPNSDLYLNGPLLKIVDQPSSATVFIGSTVVFSGFATATFDQNPTAILDGTIRYQWYDGRDNVLIDDDRFVGAATSTLTVNNILLSDNSDKFYFDVYYIPGTNTQNAINNNIKSDNATLTVVSDIEIITQPQSSVVAAGNDVIFPVEAQLEDGSTNDLSYQWYVDDQPITDGEVPVSNEIVCISVCDESTGSQSRTDYNKNPPPPPWPQTVTSGEQAIRNDWNKFRADYPNRPFYLLQPGKTKDRLLIPSYVETTSPLPGLFYSQVNRDQGSVNLASDWFTICGLSTYPSSTLISLWIDTSGSMTLNTVRASYNEFLKDCENAGLQFAFNSIIDSPGRNQERWAVEHDIPAPEDTEYYYSGSRSDTLTVSVGSGAVGLPDKDLYLEVSHPKASNSPLDSDEVTLSVVAPRPTIKFESYTINNLYKSLDIDFNDNTSYTLDSNTFGSAYSIIQFHSTEKNNTLNIEMYASKGADNGSYSGGSGGVSTIQFTADIDVEYTLIGLSNNSALFLYRGSNLIAVVGKGGDAGTSGNGGDGGGVNVSGSDGGGQGGNGGTRPNTLSLSGIYGSIYENSDIELYPDDSVANSPSGGITISCTKGSYWIDQGISPCSDNSSSDIKFVNVDGTTITGSSLIKRGFKPGYTISNTSGIGINNGGNGGNGATGGEGGTSGSGGGGGSGYSDGSVFVQSSVLGGNSGNAKVIIRVV